MPSLDDERRGVMRSMFATMGCVLVLLAIWSHFLGLPSPMAAADPQQESVAWSSVSVAGLALILGALAWWVADRNPTEPHRVHGNCRECGSRFEAEFCLRCGGTRMA